MPHAALRTGARPVHIRPGPRNTNRSSPTLFCRSDYCNCARFPVGSSRRPRRFLLLPRRALYRRRPCRSHCPIENAQAPPGSSEAHPRIPIASPSLDRSKSPFCSQTEDRALFAARAHVRVRLEENQSPRRPRNGSTPEERYPPNPPMAYAIYLELRRNQAPSPIRLSGSDYPQSAGTRRSAPT